MTKTNQKITISLKERVFPENRILLHTCCAPCSAEVINHIHNAGLDQVIVFYNPNIHPKEEYEIRKNENKRRAISMGIKFIDLDYDFQNWFEKVKGLENEPERGKRCSVCFDIRLEMVALFAYKNNFKIFATSLGISRWKNLDQVNKAGTKAASHYDGIMFLDENWRKGGGSNRMIEIAKEENFYKQEYCGCSYSLRDSNKYRTENGREKIIRSTNYYGKENSN